MKTIWSFDLGKASIGEAVRDTQTKDLPHKALPVTSPAPPRGGL